MPRFYLHLHNSSGFVRDEEGKELPDPFAAHRLAVDSIRDILSAEAKAGVIDLRGRVEIANEANEVFAVVPFTSAIELHPAEGQA